MDKINATYVSISMVQPDPNQPRKTFHEESLSELSNSIQKYGITTPLIVRKDGMMYTIIAGERRWRAARLAGLKQVPIIIREDDKLISDEISLLENIQREDLNPIDEALAYKNFMDSRLLSHEEIASIVSKSRAYVSNMLRLLNLNQEIITMIREGKLSAGHGKALLSISDENLRLSLANKIISENLSVREAEKLAKEIEKQKKTKKKEKVDRLYVDALAKELTERLKRNVQISYRPNQQGSIKIDFYSDDDLNTLADLLK